MVRGRAGGTGAPFNLGEMTVTRCSVTLDDGRVGHAYVPGRDAPARGAGGGAGRPPAGRGGPGRCSSGWSSSRWWRRAGRRSRRRARGSPTPGWSSSRWSGERNSHADRVRRSGVREPARLPRRPRRDGGAGPGDRARRRAVRPRAASSRDGGDRPGPARFRDPGLARRRRRDARGGGPSAVSLRVPDRGRSGAAPGSGSSPIRGRCRRSPRSTRAPTSTRIARRR